MVEGIVNHKMVTSIREVMGSARELLELKAVELEEHIEEANQHMETYFNAPEGYPEPPTDMELVNMLNPATAEQTKDTWNQAIKEETIKWADEFWRGDPLRPETLDSGDWWYRVLQRISDMSHRRYLLDVYNRDSEHDLGSDELGFELWHHMKKRMFRNQPLLQAYISRAEVLAGDNVGEQIWAFHPDGRIADEPEFGIRDHYQANFKSEGSKESITAIYNPSLVCFLYLAHGYSWEAIQQVSSGTGNGPEESDDKVESSNKDVG